MDLWAADSRLLLPLPWKSIRHWKPLSQCRHFNRAPRIFMFPPRFCRQGACQNPQSVAKLAVEPVIKTVPVFFHHILGTEDS